MGLFSHDDKPTEDVSAPTAPADGGVAPSDNNGGAWTPPAEEGGAGDTGVTPGDGAGGGMGNNWGGDAGTEGGADAGQGVPSDPTVGAGDDTTGTDQPV